MTAEVTSNWISLGDSFYDKVELYSGVFTAVPAGALVVSGQQGGPVLWLDRNTVTVTSASGRQLGQWKWGAGRPVAAGWSDTEQALFVLEDGTVLVYSMFGTFQSTFSMGQEAKDVKILSSRIFRSAAGTGVAVLTSTHRLYVAASHAEPRVRRLYDCGELAGSDAWAALGDRAGRLAAARKDGQLLLLTHNEMVEVESGPGLGGINRLAVSPSQARVAAELEGGAVWLGELQAGTTLCRAELGEEVAGLHWCGEDCLVAALDSGLVLVHISGQTERIFQPRPLCLVQEPDGVRVVSPGWHDLIHRVELAVQEIYRIGSVAPGSILLMASQAFQAKSHKADEYIRMIAGQLVRAVQQCVTAAGNLFQPDCQKELLRAARFGTAFLPAGESSHTFHHQCSTLKLLNSVRHYKGIFGYINTNPEALHVATVGKLAGLGVSTHPQVGIPLTAPQLASLSRPVLLDRLIARRLFPLAIRVSEFLDLPASRVLAHWACYKVETSECEEAETARQLVERLGVPRDISYSDIAERAAEVGKKQLAVRLLENEVTR